MEVDSRGRNVQCQGIGDNRYSGGTPAGPRNASSARNSRRRYARPDHNRQKFDPSIICNACKRRGHPASQCDLLAQAIFLNKYMKHSLTDLARGKLEEAWLKHWRDKLGHPNQTPGKVLRTYLDTMDISIDELDHQMCWDAGPWMTMWRTFQNCLRNDIRLVPLSIPRRYAWMHAQGIPRRLS
jgi:hypothetical protein